MSNKAIFANKNRTGNAPVANIVNNAGGRAYSLSAEHALAQFAATGCFNSTFYTSAESQIDEVFKLCQQCEPKFIAQVAVFSRESGFMKDMPAFLCAYLATVDAELLKKIFPRIINNGKMLQNFVQIMRSGKTGRKSLGSVSKKLVKNWFSSHDEEFIFRHSIGANPSIKDIIKMTHPYPESDEKNALYAYLIDKEHNKRKLSKLIREFEAYKKGARDEVPNVPFQMLTSLELDKKDWIQIALNASWQTIRMNLNTFARHGVFTDKRATQYIADKLADGSEVRKSKVFPYQLLVAYKNIDTEVPSIVANALQDALEVAVDNVPELNGTVYVFPDVSGSMSSPVTGHRAGSTTKVRCIDVAALVAASLLRRNPNAIVMPFDTRIHTEKINPRDSIMSNADKLSKYGGGGTNCSLPLTELNRQNAKGDFIIYISDNESWVDSAGFSRGTSTLTQFNKFKARNPNAKMVCLDIVPNSTTQAQESKNILNIGGFSDNVFITISDFFANRLNTEHWTGVIKKVKL